MKFLPLFYAYSVPGIGMNNVVLRDHSLGQEGYDK